MDSLDQSLDSLIASKQKERSGGQGRHGKFGRRPVSGLAGDPPKRTGTSSIQSRLGGTKHGGSSGVSKATDRLGRSRAMPAALPFGNTSHRRGQQLTSMAGAADSSVGGLPARSVTIRRQSDRRGNHAASTTIFPTAAPIVYTENNDTMLYPGSENQPVIFPIAGEESHRRRLPRSRGNPDDAWSHDLYHTIEPTAPQSATASQPRQQPAGLLGLSQAQADGPTEVRLKNFHWEASQEDIKTLLADFEPIKKCDILYDVSGRSKGEARIVFATRSKAMEAHKRFHGQILDDLELSVEVLDPVPVRAPRAPFSVHAAAFAAAAAATQPSRRYHSCCLHNKATLKTKKRQTEWQNVL